MPSGPRLDTFSSSSGTFGPALRPGAAPGVLRHVTPRGMERCDPCSRRTPRPQKSSTGHRPRIESPQSTQGTYRPFGHERIVIPKRSIILLSGIPATGKSTFARYLAREHGFAHYDLECYPRGWPHPGLRGTWEASRPAFVAQVRQLNDRIALDWGFPVNYHSWVEELESHGVRLIWFDGDVARARKVFVKRGGLAVADFDGQVRAVLEAGYPASLGCVVVPALAASGAFLAPRRIECMIFPMKRRRRRIRG